MKSELNSRRQALGSAAAVAVAVGLGSSVRSASAADTTSNRDLVKGFAEALTAHDLERFKALYSPDGFIQHQALAMTASSLGSREAVVTYFAKRIQAFPDLSVTSDVSLAEGDLICANFIYTGTHRGEYLGVPPTGKRVTFNSTDILKVRDGRFVEHWGAVDLAGLLQQLRA